MRLANFANDASSAVHFRSSPLHIPCQTYGRLSIVVHHPSVSIGAAQSGLQSNACTSNAVDLPPSLPKLRHNLL